MSAYMEAILNGEAENLQMIREEERRQWDSLTARERECLSLLALGVLNKEIAHIMGITLATSKNYLKSIYEKIGAHNRLQALLWWQRNKPEAMTDDTPIAVSVKALTEAALAVEAWWLEEGMKHFNGAPYCIFALRSALSTVKAPAEVEPVAWMTREVNVLGVGGFHEYLWPTLERAEQHQKTCGMWLCQIVPLYAAPTLSTLKPEGKQTREAAIRALDQLINEPLSGPTHGAWDRGRLSGLKEARALLTEGETENG